jgi:tetratricopeptide (TPR) repeat protein
MDSLTRAKELFFAALGHQERGELAAAERLYRQALELAPERPSILNNLAAVLLRSRRFAEAEPLCRKLASTDPTNATAILNLGNCRLGLKSTEEALAAFETALAIQPGYAEALVGRAAALLDLDRPGDALASCDSALASKPDCIEAWTSRGVCLRRLSRGAEALASYDKALAIDPRRVDALTGRGNILLDLGRLEEAMASCELALALQPDHPEALNSRAGLLLLTGRLEEGWREYRHRPARVAAGAAATEGAERFASLARGSAVVVRGEQGLGDQLFFLRWLPALRERGLKPRLQMEPRLAPLLARSPDISPEERELSAREVPAGAVLIGDLPALLAGSDRYPSSIRLAASPHALDAMRARLQELGPPPYVGVAWRAGTPLKEQGFFAALLKAVPIETLARTLEGVSATVVSIQRNPEAGATDTLARLARLPVHDLSATNRDLEELLALTALLDEYVGVSSTSVHLRHAAGRSSKVLVPNPPEWRWGAAGESPWFPGTRVYRELVGRGWDEPVAALRRDLGLEPSAASPA